MKEVRMLFLLLWFTGIFLVIFGICCAVATGQTEKGERSARFVYLLVAIIFVGILALVAILAPHVGQGRPDPDLPFEGGKYQIVAVGQIEDGKVELLLSDGEYGSRYYKLSMKKLGLAEVSEELEGQWLVVKKLKGYDYKIVPGK